MTRDLLYITYVQCLIYVMYCVCSYVFYSLFQGCFDNSINESATLNHFVDCLFTPKTRSICMREISLRFLMNLYNLIFTWLLKFIFVFSSKYQSTQLLSCRDPRGLAVHQQRPWPSDNSYPFPLTLFFGLYSPLTLLPDIL
jgi:hypothetical protein